ncbi:hypothetical protein E2C01_030182 [Portunus trituberculatus]|uniref:Uncharacterized protein n=1 Tax=Portunus trituberculatus TaxID=210409 RepID=A0A5B7EWM0_PORTR|nr:hypothetical protein [Portunus trituberculatus]
MQPKHPATSPAMLPSIAKKTRKSLTLEVKLDIIHSHEGQQTLLTHSVLRTTFVALREMPPVHDRGPIFDESQN